MYKIFDAHAHVYPEKIAEKAARAIGAFYDIPMRYNGTVDTLAREGEKAGIRRFLVHSVATSAKQVAPINDFIAEEVCARPNTLTGFATMHPELENPEAELERAYALGLRGVKLHPDFQRFMISDPRMDACYAKISEMGLPVLFHTGDSRYDWSAPAHIPILRKKHPDLIILCAHFGGYTQWDEAKRILPGEGVYVDTSSSFFARTDDEIRSYIKAYGVERVLFGTDYPMWDLQNEIQNILRLRLTEEDTQRIFYGNLAALLGIRD